MKAILFDLDDTLTVDEQAAVDSFLAVGEVLHQRHSVDPQDFHETIRRCARMYWQQAPARAWCLAVGISSWEGLWADFQGDKPELKVMQAWSPEYRHSAWTAALDELGIDIGLADELAVMFVEERDKRHSTFPDVLPALEALSASHRLAVVTNGFPYHQLRKLRGAGLESFFKTVVVSGDHGVGKPDTIVFTATLSLLGVGAHEAYMVGDSLQRDIAGARALGIRAIWLNRDNKSLTDDITPDAVITSLDQLPEILDKQPEMR